MLKIVKLSTYDGFTDYKEMWDGLFSRSRINNIFLTYDWIDACIRHFCKKGRLLILNVFKDEQLVGIAPLMIKKCRYFLIPVKTVCFIGTAISDRMDFILDGNKEENITFVLDYLMELKNTWDIIDFREIAEDSGSMEIIKSWLSGKKIANVLGQSKKSFFIELNKNRDFIFQFFSKKFQKIFKKKKGKLKGLNLEFNRYSGKDEIEKIFYDLTTIERFGWKGKKEAGIFSKEDIRDFHKEIFKKFLINRWVDVYILTIDKKPAAFVCNFLYGQKSYNYSLAYDERYSKLSPGAMLILWSIKNSIARGISEFDFIRGEEHWKHELTQSFRVHSRIKIFKNTLYFRGISYLQTRVMPYIRKVKILYQVWTLFRERFI